MAGVVGEGRSREDNNDGLVHKYLKGVKRHNQEGFIGGRE